MNAEQERELASELEKLRDELARAEQQSADGRLNPAATRALYDSLRQSMGSSMDEHAETLRRLLAEAERDRATLATTLPDEDRQHLRFAGMVGNTNVEVRGLSSVDVSYDNSTGELLIRTMDSTIRVKAPTDN
jgi:hypothetical protein